MRSELLAAGAGEGAGAGRRNRPQPGALSPRGPRQPDPDRARPAYVQAAAPARREGRPGAELVEAGAEDLPFEDDSFDTVVVTLVLCTVPDQPAALKEIARVLDPAASCSSSSTSAPKNRPSPNGRTAWRSPGASSATAATATATPSRAINRRRLRGQRRRARPSFPRPRRSCGRWSRAAPGRVLGFAP